MKKMEEIKIISEVKYLNLSSANLAFENIINSLYYDYNIIKETWLHSKETNRDILKNWISDWVFVVWTNYAYDEENQKKEKDFFTKKIFLELLEELVENHLKDYVVSPERYNYSYDVITNENGNPVSLVLSLTEKD